MFIIAIKMIPYLTFSLVIGSEIPYHKIGYRIDGISSGLV